MLFSKTKYTALGTLGSLCSLGFCLVLTTACSEGSGTETEDETSTGDDTGESEEEDESGADDTSAEEEDTEASEETGDTDSDSDTGEGDEATCGEEEVVVDVEADTWNTNDYDREAPYNSVHDDDGFALEIDDSDGSPDAPALRLDAPFVEYGDYAEFEWHGQFDLEGKELVLPFKYISGGNTDADCPMGIKFFVKSTDAYAYGQRAWLNIEFPPDTWQKITFDLTLAEIPDDVRDVFDPSDILTIGLAVETGDCGGDYEAMAEENGELPQPAVFMIDNISMRTICE